MQTTGLTPHCGVQFLNKSDRGQTLQLWHALLFSSVGCVENTFLLGVREHIPRHNWGGFLHDTRHA